MVLRCAILPQHRTWHHIIRLEWIIITTICRLLQPPPPAEFDISWPSVRWDGSQQAANGTSSQSGTHFLSIIMFADYKKFPLRFNLEKKDVCLFKSWNLLVLKPQDMKFKLLLLKITQKNIFLQSLKHHYCTSIKSQWFDAFSVLLLLIFSPPL